MGEHLEIDKEKRMNYAEQKRLREEIVQFCAEPRTAKEVAEHFGISGISAAAFLSGLRCNDVCVLNERTNKYKTRKRFLK